MKNWLAALMLCFPATGLAYYPAGDRIAGVIGILPLPEVFGRAACVEFEAKDIALYPGAGSSSPMGRIYVAKPWRFPPEGGCERLEVRVERTAAEHRKEQVPTAEFSYENPGAIVLAREGDWFEIALQEGSAWVHIQDEERFLPIEQLLTSSLSYIGASQPVLYASPEETEEIWSGNSALQTNLPVKVRSVRKAAGRLWVEVSLLSVSPCSDESTTLPPVTGWMPVHSPDGMPAVWFNSRGC